MPTLSLLPFSPLLFTVTHFFFIPSFVLIFMTWCCALTWSIQITLHQLVSSEEGTVKGVLAFWVLTYFQSLVMHDSLDSCKCLPITPQEGFCPKEPAPGRNLTLQPISVPSTSLVMFSWYLNMTQTRLHSYQDTGVCREECRGVESLIQQLRGCPSSWNAVQGCAKLHFLHFQGAFLFPVLLK